MAELIYIDTNIWIDYFLDRTDYMRPLGEFAYALFSKSLTCKYNIIISNLVLYELQKKGFEQQAKTLITEFKQRNKVTIISFSNTEIQNAKKYPHWQDRLHEILASKGNATYLVTRNIKDFEGDLVQIKFPEDL